MASPHPRHQPQVLDERLEIPVAEQQGVAALQAAGGDQGVDGLAGRDAEGAQGPIVPRGLQRDVAAADLDQGEGAERRQSAVEVALACEALQHFGQDQVADGQGLDAQQAVQALDLRGRDAPEEVDPDAGVDEDHPSVRIASRSPSQASRPRSSRTAA